MQFTTILILVIIYLLLLILSMFIENRTYKMYYFLIIVLGTLTYLNIYLAFHYYVRLRNDPGIRGPRGPKGDPGPRGKKGGCDINSTCANGGSDVITPAMMQEIANRFNTTPDCLNKPSTQSCNGGAREVRRIEPVSSQIRMLEEMARERQLTQSQVESKLARTLDALSSGN